LVSPCYPSEPSVFNTVLTQQIRSGNPLIISCPDMAQSLASEP